MKLYELVGKDKTQGFSPYVWRSRMALAHKGCTVEMAPLIFTEIADVEGANAKTVPILEHNGTFITDSWNIACYLDEQFPDRPPLFNGAQGKAQANLFNNIFFYNLVVPLFPALVGDIFNVIDDRDRDYFRTSREARLGKSLEEAAAQQEDYLAQFRKQLWPYNQTLKAQDYFDGASPAYSDYIMYGLFQWAKGVSPCQLLNTDDPLHDWRARMDDLYDGLGKVIKPRV
tara:strand:+ start:1746 stop:2432 length:687 start_codon:yes stop_codon:yes gene_type:complete